MEPKIILTVHEKSDLIFFFKKKIFRSQDNLEKNKKGISQDNDILQLKISRCMKDDFLAYYYKERRYLNF